jgi:hypothetical protein
VVAGPVAAAEPVAEPGSDVGGGQQGGTAEPGGGVRPAA